jgi:hypothetical protein
MFYCGDILLVHQYVVYCFSFFLYCFFALLLTMVRLGLDGLFDIFSGF